MIEKKSQLISFEKAKYKWKLLTMQCFAAQLEAMVDDHVNRKVSYFPHYWKPVVIFLAVETIQ